METLHPGSRAISVPLLQRLLNKKGARPALPEDGVFGPVSRAALMDFQRRERITADGVAGPTTWSRLGLKVDITHPVSLAPQPTGTSCWSAAATMILGSNQSVGPGSATLLGGGLEPSPQNVAKFAQGLGWTMHHPQSWSVDGLANLMRNKPIWAVGGGLGWLHAIVMSGLWSDGAADGSGTLLRIHDPWPPNVGAVYGRFYRGTINGFDFISMYILNPRG
jgi:hypothetical protein